MANPNGKPPTQHQWKPGQSGNPSGKPKGLLTVDDVKAMMYRFWRMSADELLMFLQDPKAPMGELMIASVMARAVKDGDFSRLAFLLDRSVGKVKEEIEQTVRSITDEDLDKIPRDALIKLVSGQK